MKHIIAFALLALTACATPPQDLPGWRLVSMEPYDKDPKCRMSHLINDDVPHTIMSKIECPNTQPQE